MNKIGVYILLIVVGGAIGASALFFFLPNQTPVVAEQEVKVTIQSIEYDNSDYSVLKIELLNDAPEKNLDGIIGIYQNNRQWTGEVTWHYSGYGEAIILCDTITENQSFSITYTEKNPEQKYLDRTIEWWEIEVTVDESQEVPDEPIEFIETRELTITDALFVNSGPETIEVKVSNTGNVDVTVASLKVNGVTQSNWNMNGTGNTVAAGDNDTIVITCDWTPGNKYAINIFTNDGTMIAVFTDTA